MIIFSVTDIYVEKYCLGKMDLFWEELCQFVKGIVVFNISVLLKIIIIIYGIVIQAKIFSI